MSGPVPVSRPIYLTLRRVAGNLLLVLGIVGLGIAAAIQSADLDFLSTIALGTVVSLVSVGVGMLGRHISLTARGQSNALRAASSSRDPRPPVLYLRAFADDTAVADANVTNDFVQFSTEEERLARVVEPIGPLTAIGDPRQPLPMPGAIRVYESDESWQARVIAFLEQAPLVILRLSETPGLLWELQTAVQRLEPRRLLVLVPGGRGAVAPALLTVATRLLPRPLPEQPAWQTNILDLHGIVRFRADWTPEYLPTQFSMIRWMRSRRSHLRTVLNPVFEALGAQ